MLPSRTLPRHQSPQPTTTPQRYETSRQNSCDQCSCSETTCNGCAEACQDCCRQDLDCSKNGTHAHGTATSGEVIEIMSDNDGNGGNGDGDVEMPNSQENPGTDATFVALLESLKGANTSVHFLSNDGCSLPVMDVATTQSCLILFPDKTKEEKDKENTMDFTNLRLSCSIKINKIQNRWLNPFPPTISEVKSHYPHNIASLIGNILKSYAGTAIRGRGLPPFVHPSQTTDTVSSQPLVECLTLVKILDNPMLGPQLSVGDLIESKMTNIRTQYCSYNEMGVLSAFQACLIYALTLSFYVRQESKDLITKTMTMLQDMACHVARQGVATWQEQHGACPRWEEWIVAEAKRRAIFTMYLFDTMLALDDKLPTYLFFEIQSLPAPGPKSLWQAQSRSYWTKAYTAYSLHWDRGAYLQLAELWPPPATFGGQDRLQRKNRVELWLEDIDEFGTMFYTIMASVDLPGWNPLPVKQTSDAPSQN